MLLIAKAAIGPATLPVRTRRDPGLKGWLSAQVGGTDLLCSRAQKVLGTGWPHWTMRTEPVQDAPPPRLSPAQATGNLGSCGPYSQAPGLQRHLEAAVPRAGVGGKGHEELRHFLPLCSDRGPQAACRHSRLCVLGLVLPATAAAVDADADEDEGCSQAARDARVQGHVHGGCERQSRELHRPTAALSPGLGGQRATGRDAAGQVQPSSRPRECGRLLGTLAEGKAL